MRFLDALRKAFGGGGAGGGGDESYIYYIYAKCRRCGEPLRARVDLRNEPSRTEDEEGWVVRKGLVGSGAKRCFQTVDVTLTFDAQKREVLDSEVVGGELISKAEYEALVQSG